MPADTQVEELLGCSEELRAGGRAPAAEELCRDCPELLGEVARRVAASQAMAGRAVTYDHFPIFYSDLFELAYEAVGEVDSQLETVADWKEPYQQGVVYYLRDGRVRGVLMWNVWEQVDAARKLIAERGPFRPESVKGRFPT
jgi:hypothetical protein